MISFHIIFVLASHEKKLLRSRIIYQYKDEERNKNAKNMKNKSLPSSFIPKFSYLLYHPNIINNEKLFVKNKKRER